MAITKTIVKFLRPGQRFALNNSEAAKYYYVKDISMLTNGLYRVYITNSSKAKFFTMSGKKEVFKPQ